MFEVEPFQAEGLLTIESTLAYTTVLEWSRKAQFNFNKTNISVNSTKLPSQFLISYCGKAKKFMEENVKRKTSNSWYQTFAYRVLLCL